MLDVERYLVHSADLYLPIARVETSAFSSSASPLLSPTPVPTACFAYFGSTDFSLDRLLQTRVIQSAPSKWQVLLPPTWINSLIPGSVVDNILDESQNPIRERGIVDTIDVYRHHIYGAMLIIVKLND